MGDRHNGVNFMRAACVIAMEKAYESFEPMLDTLRLRMAHIMKRLYPLIQEHVQRTATTSSGSSNLVMSSQNKQFQYILQNIYNKFVDEKLEQCIQYCRIDLEGLTRYVTFDQEEDVDDEYSTSSSNNMNNQLLPTPKRMTNLVECLMITKAEKEIDQNILNHNRQNRYNNRGNNENNEEDGEENEEEYSNTNRKYNYNNNNYNKKNSKRRILPRIGWRFGGISNSNNRKKVVNSKEKVIAEWEKVIDKSEKQRNLAMQQSDSMYSGWEKSDRGLWGSSNGDGMRVARMRPDEVSILLQRYYCCYCYCDIPMV